MERTEYCNQLWELTYLFEVNGCEDQGRRKIFAPNRHHAKLKLSRSLAKRGVVLHQVLRSWRLR